MFISSISKKNNTKEKNQSNIFGILSIIAGVVSLFTAGLAGLVGLILGIVGLVKNEKKNLCWIGIILSCLSWIIIILFLGGAMFAL